MWRWLEGGGARVRGTGGEKGTKRETAPRTALNHVRETGTSGKGQGAGRSRDMADAPSRGPRKAFALARRACAGGHFAGGTRCVGTVHTEVWDVCVGGCGWGFGLYAHNAGSGAVCERQSPRLPRDRDAACRKQRKVRRSKRQGPHTKNPGWRCKVVSRLAGAKQAAALRSCRSTNSACCVGP